MKLHLPVRLFKSVLACLAAVASFSLGSGVAWADAQNLTFSGSSLIWDTSAENKPFVDEEDAAASFAAGDNVSFTGESTVTLGENITAGTLDIAAGADVTIGLGNYTLHTDTISLSGTLAVGNSLSIASGSTLAVQNDAAVLDSTLVLGEKSGLAVDAAASLNNNTLTLQGGSNLILTAAGDGKTYTLFTGVSGLVDAEGNAITLDSTNNAIANYFDTTRPGTGFWAGATLVLNDGALQLVRHNETVKEAVTITTRRTSGADYQYYAGVTFENIEYAAVDSDAYGGAIDGVSSANTLSNNGSVTFSGNTASSSYYACGGAIYGNANSSISVTDNGSVCFVQNMVSVGLECCGGAIYGDEYSTISLNNNGSVEFKGNTTSAATSVAAYSYGGAIYGGTHSRISLSGNGIVIFSKNSAPASELGAGGAICGDTITLSNNISINCSDNMAFSFGGAIYGYSSSTISLSDNGCVTFSGNSAPWGGAIVSTKLNILDNASVVFNENSASNQGAAINGSNISLSENGSVIFRGNTVSALDAQGGAIYTYGNLSICNNDSVLFEKNAEVSNGTYRLRSIYAVVGSDAVISLSAAAGKIIEFRDSVYVGSGTSVNLNQTYGEIEQKGDIIFTGATTVDDLYTVKGNVAGTEEEIRLSRTTEVNALTNLYGGRLRVEDGAIYQGQGITAHEDSGATVRVKDATLSHSGYDLTFNAGTTLELEGTNSITGNVQMLEGSTMRLKDATVNGAEIPLTFNAGTALELAGTNSISGNVQMLEDSILSFDGTETQGVTILSGNMSFTGAPTVSLGDTPAWTGENHALLYVSGTISGWDADTLTVLGSAYGSANLHWLNNELLVLNYNAETFNPHFRGDLVISSRQQGSACHKYKYFADVSFENITEASNGGAIYGGDNSTITLSGNGSVTFSGNTVSFTSSSYPYSTIVAGGAIYGGNGSTITLSDNESVTFSGNTLSAPEGQACGGAIYGGDNSTITLSGNGSVTFSGNTASSSYAAHGGVISGSRITIVNNDSVAFSGNTASSTSSFAHGGAIFGMSIITLSNNGSVTFSENSASSTASSADGGAIDGSTITLSNNGSVTFSGNTAKSTSDSGYNGASGGAIYGSFITLSNNKGSITFSGNTASSSDSYAYGGAIYGGSYSTITLSDNGSVTFSGNTASSSSPSAYGGAIYTNDDLSICNNDSVLFEKNVEKSDSSYRLRSIYAGGSNDVISLSAAASKSIEFRDSVYIASGSTVNLNADYTYLDEAGESVTIRQTGDIIFTGADTEQHLNDLLEAAGAGRTATAQEILNSRTTEVCAMTNLYGGRLRVEEGAIYQGQGITAHEASEATVRVKDAELSHAGYNLEFNAGTALEVAGNSTIRGNVNLKEGSLFKLEQAASLSLHETVEADAATLTVNGGALLEGSATLNASLTLADGATLDMDALEAGAVTLNGALTFGGQVTMGDKLLGILSEMSGWEESVTLFTGLTDLVLPAVAADDAADRLWVGNVFSNLAGNENYYFNYVPEVGSLAVVHVPEPATTTLGLLALSALAVRRRRK